MTPPKSQAGKPDLRGRSRAAVLSFLGVFVAANLGLSAGMDTAFPELRDPEYGRRLKALPSRPVAVALGSSRVAVGLRGNEAFPVFNFGTYGGGPVTTALLYRRLRADGVRPATVWLEVWPAFLRQDGEYAEERRLDPHRLTAADRPFVREHFTSADETLRLMADLRVWPWYQHRGRLLNQALPHWLPPESRLDGTWARFDAWGGRPGPAGGFAAAWPYYRRLFDGFAVSPAADRALRDVLTRCRDDGVPVRLLWLPESSAFRAGVPADVSREVDRYLEALRTEFAVPLTDAREWVDDEHLPDGFHLTPAGAERFTRRLAEEGP